jgi:hypothetical protein
MRIRTLLLVTLFLTLAAGCVGAVAANNSWANLGFEECTPYSTGNCSKWVLNVSSGQGWGGTTNGILVRNYSIDWPGGSDGSTRYVATTGNYYIGSFVGRITSLPFQVPWDVGNISFSGYVGGASFNGFMALCQYLSNSSYHRYADCRGEGSEFNPGPGCHVHTTLATSEPLTLRNSGNCGNAGGAKLYIQAVDPNGHHAQSYTYDAPTVLTYPGGVEVQLLPESEWMDNATDIILTATTLLTPPYIQLSTPTPSPYGTGTLAFEAYRSFNGTEYENFANGTLAANQTWFFNDTGVDEIDFSGFLNLTVWYYVKFYNPYPTLFKQSRTANATTLACYDFGVYPSADCSYLGYPNDMCSAVGECFDPLLYSVSVNLTARRDVSVPRIWYHLTPLNASSPLYYAYELYVKNASSPAYGEWVYRANGLQQNQSENGEWMFGGITINGWSAETWELNRTFSLRALFYTENYATVLGWSNEANATTVECYDQKTVPSLNCQRLGYTDDRICSANGTCVKQGPMLALACGGRGHDSDCIGLTVYDNSTLGYVCTLAGCWCDWLSTPTPMCRAKTTQGSDCYSGRGCLSGFCRDGVDTGTNCGCGSDGCSNMNETCLFGNENQGNDQTQVCWVNGTCQVEGGAGTGMYLNATVLANGSLYLNWTLAVGTFTAYEFQVQYLGYDGFYRPTDQGLITDAGKAFSCSNGARAYRVDNIATTNYTIHGRRCTLGPMRVRVFESATYNYSNWVDVNLVECYNATFDCPYGSSSCRNGSCWLAGSCVNDSDCPLGNSFCKNPYCYYDQYPPGGGPSAIGMCLTRKATGSSCIRDGECTSLNCNQTLVDGSCPYGPAGDYLCGVTFIYQCLSNNTCVLPGTCSDTNNYCAADADCDVLYPDYSRHCTNNQCVADVGEAGYCLTNKTCRGFENGTLKCVGTQCVNAAWECNHYGAGCPAGEYCNYSSSSYETLGDHQCYPCATMGSNCTGNLECCPGVGQCLDSHCEPSSYECLYNNPPTSGKPGNTYCAGLTGTANTAWCYVQELGADEGRPAGAASPNYQCHLRYGEGQRCKYNYQCLSQACSLSQGICGPMVPVPMPPGVTLEVLLDDSHLPVHTISAGTSGHKIIVKLQNETQTIPSTCTYQTKGLLPGSNSLNLSSTSGSIVFSSLTAVGDAGDYSISVSCVTPQGGYYQADAYPFTILPPAYTEIDCTKYGGTSCPKKGDGGTDIIVSVYHILPRSNNQQLSGSQCILTMDSVDTYPLESAGSKKPYTSSIIRLPTVTTTSTSAITISCENPGWDNATLQWDIEVTPDHCQNDVQDSGETGTDCGGTCPKECAEHCSNGDKDADETDTDCGGRECKTCENEQGCERNRDCASGWCSNKDSTETKCTSIGENHLSDPGECDDPECYDDCWNGQEGGIDCGGICPNECPCMTNPDCKQDGSEHCYVPTGEQEGECVLDVCHSNGECGSLVWTGGVIRSRICNVTAGHCVFGTAVSDAGLIIQPLSGMSYIEPTAGAAPGSTAPAFRPFWTVSGNVTVFLHICDGTGKDGYRLSSKDSTLKYYQIITSNPLRSPSVAPDYAGNYFFGGESYTKLTVGRIEQICKNFPAGSDYVYSEVLFTSVPEAGVYDAKTESAVGISFREAFKVTVTGAVNSGDSNVFWVNMTRNATCNITASRVGIPRRLPGWESTPLKQGTFNYSSLGGDFTGGIPVFFVECTSVYGETFPPVSSTFDIMAWLPRWQTWMVWLIVFILAIPVPLIIIVLIWALRRRGKP